MDKDVVVQVKRVKEGFVTECNIRTGSEMFVLIKSLNVLSKQLKEKIETDMKEQGFGDYDCDNCDEAATCPVAKTKTRTTMNMKNDNISNEDTEEIKKNLHKLKGDKKGMEQFIKDLKGLLKGK